MRDRVKQNMTMSGKKIIIKVTGIRGKNEKTDSPRKREFIVRSKEVWKTDRKQRWECCVAD